MRVRWLVMTLRIGRSPTSLFITLWLMSLIVVSRLSTLNIQLYGFSILYWTIHCTSMMFKSPVSMRLSLV